MLGKIFSFFSPTTNTAHNDENLSLLSAFDTTIDMNELEENNNYTIANPNEDQQEDKSAPVRKPTPRTQKLLNEKQKIEDAIKEFEEEIQDIPDKIEKNKTEESLLDECIKYLETKRRGFVAQHPWLTGGVILALAGTGFAADYLIKSYNWRLDVAMDKELAKYPINDFSDYPPEYFPGYTCANIIPSWYYCRPVDSFLDHDTAAYYCQNIALALCKELQQEHSIKLGVSGGGLLLGVLTDILCLYKIMSHLDFRNDSTLKSLLAKVGMDIYYDSLDGLYDAVVRQSKYVKNVIEGHQESIKIIEEKIERLQMQIHMIDNKINAINMYETNHLLFQAANRKASNSESAVHALPREIAQEIFSYVNPEDFLPAKPKI